MTRRMLFALIFGSAAALTGARTTVSADPPEAKPMQIGMAKTFFNDIPKPFVDVATGPFKDVMKQATGLDGELVPEYGPFEVAKKLNDSQMQLGVFHGHEFAWVQQKYPKLTPLMIAVNKHHDVRAFLVVHKDSPIKTAAELRGQKLMKPFATKQHCWVFVEKYCTNNAAGDPKDFFGAIEKTESAETAFAEVCKKTAQAAIVDTIGLEFYKVLTGPRFDNNLRILKESDPFPQAVIVYKQGVLNDATITKIREGLAKAHETELGRDMMDMWKISSFDPVPADYAKSLTNVLKAYPAPR